MFMDKIRLLVPRLRGLAIRGGLWIYRQMVNGNSVKAAAAVATVEVTVIVTGIATLSAKAVILGATGVVGVAVVAACWAGWAVYQEVLRMVADGEVEVESTWVDEDFGQPLLIDCHVAMA